MFITGGPRIYMLSTLGYTRNIGTLCILTTVRCACLLLVDLTKRGVRTFCFTNIPVHWALLIHLAIISIEHTNTKAIHAHRRTRMLTLYVYTKDRY